jgi:hypothetical protein
MVRSAQPWILSVALVGALSTTSAGEAEAGRDDALKRCRYLHQQIEKYTDRRRAGGSGAQMERWRKSRQRYESEYRQRRCHRFGSRLLIDR